MSELFAVIYIPDTAMHSFPFRFQSMGIPYKCIIIPFKPYCSTDFILGAKSQEQTYFNVLERDLSTVHPALFTSLDNIGRSQVEQLLRRLGVKSWSPRDLINCHIIPTFKSDKWKVSHLCFVLLVALCFSPAKVLYCRFLGQSV